MTDRSGSTIADTATLCVHAVGGYEAVEKDLASPATGAQKIVSAARAIKTDLTSLSEGSAADNAKAEGAITAATNLVKEYNDSNAGGRVGQITVDGLMGQVADVIGVLCK